MIKNAIKSRTIKSRVRNVLARLFNKNTIGAYVLQADKGLFAFVVLPLLAYKLGIASFGVFSTFLSLSIIAGLLVDWGFSQTAVRSIAIANGVVKARIAGGVILAKLVLFWPVSCLVFVAGVLAPPLDGYSVLGMLVVLTVFASAISPVFLFQGTEKTFEVGGIVLVIRLLSLLLISFFVTSPDDLNLAFAIYSLSALSGMLLSWLFLLRVCAITIDWPSASEAKSLVAKGFDFTVANVGSTFYGNGSVFLLSLVCPSAQVGNFSLALAFTRGLCSILTPVSQSYLPKIARLYEESFSRARIALHKALALQIMASSAVVMIAYLVLIYLLPMVTQRNLHDLPQLITILLPTIGATVVSSLLVSFVLVPLGLDRFYRNLVIFSSLIGAICLLLMGYLFQAHGAALSILLLELFICLAILYRSKQALRRS